MSLYADMRKTKEGNLDLRSRAYRFDDRLIQDSKKDKVPDNQKKITDYFKLKPFASRILLIR